MLSMTKVKEKIKCRFQCTSKVNQVMAWIGISIYIKRTKQRANKKNQHLSEIEKWKEVRKRDEERRKTENDRVKEKQRSNTVKYLPI